jgi:ElaB/YqjD/DUF883 family membrane-anchored ribosome-binding protein
MTVGRIGDLEREIEGTRRELDQTLYALQTQLSPRHQLQMGWNYTKRATERTRRAGARWVSSNPMPAMAIAAAVGAALGGAIYLGVKRRG